MDIDTLHALRSEGRHDEALALALHNLGRGKEALELPPRLLAAHIADG